MIGSIKGTIIWKNDRFVIVETAGVGYKISVSVDTISRLASRSDSGQKQTSEPVSFWIHTHIREDAFDLYGFLEHEELEFFEMLISVSGIGPKGALNILSVASLDTLKGAIGTGDTAYLTKVSGIGRKTAEKIVLELRDKLKSDKTESSLQGEMDALEALKSLGYSQNEARDALKKIPTILDTNAKIKAALKMLSNK